MTKAYQLFFGSILVILCLSTSPLSLAQERSAEPDYSWLNGRWSGPVPAGDNIQMRLEVSNKNEITGQGEIGRRGKLAAARPTITGSITGNQVTLQMYFSRAQQTTTYLCNYVEGSLQCKTKRGFETTFQKVQ
ncbi:MAG: hypothetical protein HY695_07630 [Deltaproteobacteria bacterium]|nr:hypothetical protein [Deltaproteobacteria bacterium]